MDQSQEIYWVMPYSRITMVTLVLHVRLAIHNIVCYTVCTLFVVVLAMVVLTVMYFVHFKNSYVVLYNVM